MLIFINLFFFCAVISFVRKISLLEKNAKKVFVLFFARNRYTFSHSKTAILNGTVLQYYSVNLLFTCSTIMLYKKSLKLNYIL